MKHAKPAPKLRLKLALMAVGMAALGALLVYLYIRIQPDPGYPAASTTATRPATTAPASAPASAPAPTRRPPPEDPKAASARNMSAMLLLFGLMSFTVSGVCVLLIILDIRKSRPAWKTQTKYPRRR
jgi:hypothetical protein